MPVVIPRLINGDCLDVLASLEPGSIGLCLTSPPFNANREYETGLWATLADYRRWLNERMTALYPVCASGAWVVVELQDMYVSPEHSHALPGQAEQFSMATAAYLTVAMIERGFYYKTEAVWDRGRFINSRAGRMSCAPGSPAMLTQHSRVLFFRKPGGRRGAYRFRHLLPDGQWKARWCRSVWSHVRPERDPAHPAVMPLDMALGVVEGWSLPDETVLDPFMGRGTAVKAAQMLGRGAIGIDLRGDYCARAAGWLGGVEVEWRAESATAPE